MSVAGERQIRQISRTVPAATSRALRQAGLLIPGTIPRPSRASIAARVMAVAAAAAPSVPRAHVVQTGDNLWNLSRQYGVTVEQLASANRLALTSTLKLGQELAIPASGSEPAPTQPVARPAASQGSTVVHVVQSGETLWDIAARYGTHVEDLMTLNDLGHDDWIKPGQRLVITGHAVPRYRQIAEQTRGRAGQFRSEPVMADASIMRDAGAFLWPSRGMITSRFGWRYRHHHDGIDIASPRGTPIYATRDGVVEFAGWHGGYGKVVFLDHGSGLVTIYGHASELLVQPGQHVKKGQMIARVGCTGACTGSHVHFEVRVNDRAVDPLPFLK
jgi:murein DD-endopeptidase MepM/ murein hydrolase activator NlpD